MIHGILNIFLIIALTIISAFVSVNISGLIIAGSIIMILITYDLFNDIKSKGLTVVKLLLIAVYGCVSKDMWGYISFSVVKEIKWYFRIICSVCSYICFSVFLYHNNLALCIAKSFIIIVLDLIIIGINYIIDKFDEKRNIDVVRVTEANIREMHEKRLNEELIKQNILVEKNARLIERENISRNIHNSVGHSITAAIMTLDAADMLYDVKPEDARKKMNDANERMRGSLDSIRRAVRVLDDENNDIMTQDLKSEFDIIINEFVMDTDIKVNVFYDELPDNITLPHDYMEFLTGVLQEMLTNGFKHGNANSYYIKASGDSANIRLEVSDNGNSDFSKNNSEIRIKQGFGLKKIISFVDKHGGKTYFYNHNGFKSIVELPIILEANNH